MKLSIKYSYTIEKRNYEFTSTTNTIMMSLYFQRTSFKDAGKQKYLNTTNLKILLQRTHKEKTF